MRCSCHGCDALRAAFCPARVFRIHRRRNYYARLSPLQKSLSQRQLSRWPDDFRSAREFRSEFTVLTWQFPVLAKYHFLPQSHVQRVIEGGPSFRLSGNTNSYNPSLFGVTAGIGLETNYRVMKISPVLRYTHWTPDPVRNWLSERTKPNQIEFLVSFTF